MAAAKGEAAPAEVNAAGAARGSSPPGEVWEAYELWCNLLDLSEDAQEMPFQKVMQLLTQGGEIFRSFIQFLARVWEPHKGEWQENELREEEALRRSFVAMQIACRALACPATSAGIEGTQVLGLVCCELLGGLQPRSRGSSLHICTVLQHLLSAHEKEVCSVLLQYHTPFVLLRTLNQPGCAELLLGLLVGCDSSMLLPLIPNQSLSPLSADRMEQVLAYLRETRWPSMLASLLQQGALLSGSSAPSAPAKALHSPARGHVGSPVRAHSPPVVSTPSRRRNARWPGSPSTPGWPSPGLGSGSGLTPQRLSTPVPCREAMSPFQTMAAVPSSPSVPQALSPMRPRQQPGSPLQVFSPQREASLSPRPFLAELPSFPGARPPQVPPPLRVRRRPTPEAQKEPVEVEGEAKESRRLATALAFLPSPARMRSAVPSASSAALASASPLPEKLPGSAGAASAAGRLPCKAAAVEEEESAPREGVGVLLDFLIALMEACGRASEALRRSRQQQQQRQQREAEANRGEDGVCSQREERAEVRLRLLQSLLLESPLISHLFQLLQSSSPQLEVLTALQLILQHALNPKRDCRSLLEPLLSAYLQHTEVLGTLLLQNSPNFRSSLQPRRRLQQQPRCGRPELRLNSYTVREPLGALRVTAVQVLADLCELCPERALRLVKPQVWELLVQWFLHHRCNHIFQAACGRILIVVVQHGTAKLQHFVFVRCQLLAGLCDAVLAEGACGDRWHELRPVKRPPRSGAPSASRAEKVEVAACRKRHPGGLAGLVQVVLALASRAARACEDLDETLHEATPPPISRQSTPQRGETADGPLAAYGPPAADGPGEHGPPAERGPPADVGPPAKHGPLAAVSTEDLAAVVGGKCADAADPAVAAVVGAKVRAALQRADKLWLETKEERPRAPPPQCFLAKLLGQTPLWPQVLGAVGQQLSPQSFAH